MSGYSFSNAEMSFDGHVSDAELTIANQGLSTELWEPEFGWQPSEAEAGEAPHPPQLLAALQCFIAFFVKPIERVWVHLGAEMQAGKTGVINALVRLILKNGRKLRYDPRRIFVLTGMNDNAWKKQTRERLPAALHGNVYHNGGLSNFAKAITSLAAGEELANVLIILDESHLASALNNRPHEHIYKRIAELCPRAKWQENNIRFLTISATDPAKVLTISGKEAVQVVRLQTTPAYQSVESLNAAGRIRSLETFKNINSPSAIAELKRRVEEEFADAPRYHILRAPYGKTDKVGEMVRAAFPGCPVLKFDAEEKSRRSGGGAVAADDTSSTSYMEDINSILAEAPEKHTFIVLKNMLYAAKTLHDEFVGVLWDRLSGKDDTTLQSLVGRACGYGKNERTVVYTSESTVRNYLAFWRELCADPRMSPVIADIPQKEIAKRMVGVRTREVAGGVRVAAMRTVSHPLAAGGGGGAPAAGGGGGDDGSEPEKKTRQKANEDNFTHTFREYPSLAAAKAAVKHLHTPKMEGDFYLTSTSASPEKLSYAAALAICSGKKTANLPWGKLEVGKSVNRLYVGYRNITNPSSAVFVVRTLTRIR